LHSYGLYRRSDKFRNGNPIRIGIINSLSSSNPSQFWSQIEGELRRLGFAAQVTGMERIQSVSRSALEDSVGKLQEAQPHILVAFLPDEYDADEEEWKAYHDFKSLTVSRGTPSQVVYESTLSRQYAVANIVLGILGKTGNIPFVLAEPLPYADLVVGIDIARIQKRRLAGSMNATAITRIYFSSGEFLRYVIHDAPLEGETIPANFLQSLFPANEFKDKRVVIHRDGYFRGDEKKVLLDWANQIGAQVF
jgi:argonaute-like protein implicated in RNA metabolism and viral defense